MTVYILRHAPDKALGHLVGVLEGLGLSYRYMDVYRVPEESLELPADITGLVILGGEMNVDETDVYPFLAEERGFIRTVMEDGLPVFGICLGAQLIARSLGAPVVKNPVKEIGWTPILLTEEGVSDPVMGALGEEHLQFQWHEDRFELPPGAIRLAGSADCDNQAFRIGARIYGVQFHPEMTGEVIEEWLSESRSLGEERKNVIRAESKRLLSEYQQQNAEMFGRFWQRQPVNRTK